jgi:arylformamidase
VLVPNYALCPAVTIPDIVLQMVKATAWAYRNVHRFGGDPSRISVIGHSAGGHLAAMMLACDWQAYDKTLPKHLVRKAMSMSGLFELESVRATPFLSDSLRLSEADAVKASPAFMPAPKQGSLITLVGAQESEEFLRHNRLIQKAWGDKVVPVCEDIPNTNHFSILEELSFPGSRVQTLASQLLA